MEYVLEVRHYIMECGRAIYNKDVVVEGIENARKWCRNNLAKLKIHDTDEVTGVDVYKKVQSKYHTGWDNVYFGDIDEFDWGTLDEGYYLYGYAPDEECGDCMTTYSIEIRKR